MNLDPYHYGFLPGGSRISNVLIDVGSLANTHVDGHISLTVLMNFTKAFDRVPHIPLPHNLQSFGVLDPAEEFLRSVLISRTFVVKMGTHFCS